MTQKSYLYRNYDKILLLDITGDLIPMDLMRKILSSTAKAEIFVNVMDGFANRFFNVDTRARAINRLTGVENAEWRAIVHEAGPMNDKSKKAIAARRNAFIGFYIDQLSTSTSREIYHLKFGMRNERNRHKYHLVFVAQHPKAIKEMKRAMTDQSIARDDFMFSEFDKKRGVVRDTDTLERIKELILEQFAGTDVIGEEVERFVWMKTIYIFNKKVQLKKEFSDYIKVHNSKFDKILFKFPEREIVEDEEEYD